MLKWLDIPPTWLVGALGLGWVQSNYFDLGLSLWSNFTMLVSGLSVGGGILSILLAALEFKKGRTTIIPHLEASKLITSGIFKRTRNPIYMGDTLILLGMFLYWDAVLSLVLVPLFMRIIEGRFIVPEEDRLRRKFRADFARYSAKTRRWM